MRNRLEIFALCAVLLLLPVFLEANAQAMEGSTPVYYNPVGGTYYHWIRIAPAWQKNGATDLMNFLMTACSKATGISFPVQHALMLPRSFCGRAKRNFGTPCPYSSSSSKSWVFPIFNPAHGA